MGEMKIQTDDSVDRSNRAIGKLLRSTRQERGLSIESVAKAAGIGAGTISQYERGLGNPTIQTLRRLGDALDLSLAEFASTPLVADGETQHKHGAAVTQGEHGVRKGRVDVVRTDRRRQLVLPGACAIYEILSPDLDGALLVMQNIFRVGFDNFDLPFQHTGEEVLTVIEGRLEGRIGDTSVTLEPGDTVTFDASLPHGWRTLGTTDAKLYSALTPPTLK